MQPSTWKKLMSETAMTELAWRLDSVGTLAASSEMCEATKTTPITGPTSPAIGPVAARSTSAGLVRRWNDVMRTWVRERLKGLAGHSVRFEEILHEFTEIIETTDSSGAVKEALLRQARRTVPACRVELIMGPAPSHDQGPHVLAVDGGTVGGTKPSYSAGDGGGQSVLEVPLRCGLMVLGRLRIRSRTGGIASLRKETIRRLTTLCSVGACALERLDRREEWPENDDLAILADSAGAGLTPNGRVPRPILARPPGCTTRHF